jgi:hypothetical protein
MRADTQRPLCPGCGEPIGVYEPLWQVAPERGAEQTSWLRHAASCSGLDALWHAVCAETLGVDGG